MRAKTDIAKTLSLHYPYSAKSIYDLITRYQSVDLVIYALDDSLELNISLEQACYRLRRK